MMAGMLGRREPKNAKALMFKSFFRKVPTHPLTVDNKLDNWLMLGNDKAGDCVAVTWSNMRRLVTAFLSQENYPTQDQVWEVYKTQNPNFDPNGDEQINGPGSDADQGMDIQTLLEYLLANGGPDGVKPIAFAKVNANDPDEIAAAVAIFGGTWDGLKLKKINSVQFDAGKPWDYSLRSSYDGGHSVLSAGYNPGTLITWGQEIEFTKRFQLHQLEECWVVIWPENLGTKQFQQGISTIALATAYQNITGRTLQL